MADKSGIEWTEATWNPTVGCEKISPGCKFCYANVMHKRLRAMGMEKYEAPFTDVQPWEPSLEVPLHWREPRFVFVNSMSDLFHHNIDLDYIRAVFGVMARAPQHTFQVLTKRSERLMELKDQLPWPSNVWMGVSVESNAYLDRVDHLRQVPASVRFLSIEPLLGPLPDLDLTDIHWVIVGGESGPGARPMAAEWVLDIRQRCREADIPFFFKQWGGVNKRATGRELEGQTWDGRPSPAVR